MPYKDKDKDKERNLRSIKKSQEKLYFPPVQVRIRRDDDAFYDSLLDAAVMRGITTAEYLRKAAKEKLIRDDEMRT